MLKVDKWWNSAWKAALQLGQTRLALGVGTTFPIWKYIPISGKIDLDKIFNFENQEKPSEQIIQLIKYLIHHFVQRNNTL